jgi:hypothetical protein
MTDYIVYNGLYSQDGQAYQPYGQGRKELEAQKAYYDMLATRFTTTTLLNQDTLCHNVTPARAHDKGRDDENPCSSRFVDPIRVPTVPMQTLPVLENEGGVLVSPAIPAGGGRLRFSLAGLWRSGRTGAVPLPSR